MNENMNEKINEKIEIRLKDVPLIFLRCSSDVPLVTVLSLDLGDGGHSCGSQETVMEAGLGAVAPSDVALKSLDLGH